MKHSCRWSFLCLFLFLSACAQSQVKLQRLPNNDGSLPHSKAMMSDSSVALKWKEKVFCSGLQISETRVLTSARCFENLEKENFISLQENLSFEIKERKVDSLFRIYFQKEFRFSKGQSPDLAIVEFSQILPFQSDFSLEAPKQFESGDIFLTAGFGANPQAQISPDMNVGGAGVLRVSALVAASPLMSENRFHFQNDFKGQSFVCDSDLGSPLIVDRNGHMSVVGVLSEREYKSSAESQAFQKSDKSEMTEDYVQAKTCSFQSGISHWTQVETNQAFLNAPATAGSEFKGASVSFR